MAQTWPELEALATRLAPLLDRAIDERVEIGGLYGSARALILSLLARRHPVVAVVPDQVEAEALEDDLAQLASELRVFSLRAADSEADLSPEVRADLSERLTHLRELRSLTAGCIALVPVALLLEALPSDDEVDRRSVSFAVGDSCDPAKLRTIASEAGFRVVPMVGSPAEISVRGDIVDLFPLGEKEPMRIELFDDRIESIRTFSPDSQRSLGSCDSFSLPLVRPEELQDEGRSRIQEHLPAGVLLARAEPDRLVARLEESAAAFRTERPRVRVARHWLARAAGVELRGPAIDEVEAGTNVETLSVQGIGGGVEALGESLAALARRCVRIVLFAESDAEIKRLRRVLKKHAGGGAEVELEKGSLRTGFQLPDPGIAFLNHLELLGKPRVHRPRPRRPAVPAKAIQNILELREGDHVVHLTHGIARYCGMTRMKRDHGEEDFLVLEFSGETTFYLPASKIDLVQRYVGSGAGAPRLDKIGGRSWSKKKARVEAALEDLAGELLEVQAAREARDASHHTVDDPLITEFEASFPYQDTVDQARSMTEIHQDLGSTRPMDRLLCGDVGFGKTELAIRAAFRAVVSGHQVAVLVPTTLLAEQHGQVFQSRLAPYPVRVESLSRFRSRKRQTEIVEGLRDGTVDVVIGTHRLVSRDVGFKNLGLVIVDEEQRFGVKAKEALKKLRRAVDVLTLSATPIPRTLHMALVGLRDISSLNTPPQGRRPVKTEIRKFDPELIRKAALFELTRGGQVFLIHNRVRSIDRLADQVAALVPTARVTVAHGQMPESDLESAVAAFANREADILVSTSIVESGLDLPHANTMLIDRPELFGLADLHQLRGRVGRSELQAFCYLLVADKPLSEVSERRLKAVEELSHLGAGYDISIKDLEIRGAGNLLGAAQSGHIAAVGYDLFVRLLRRVVARAQGESRPGEPVETDVDLGVEAFLPADFVPDPGQRMELLRRYGQPDGPSLAEMEEEIRDRFGRPPLPATNLLRVYDLKRTCRRLGIRRLLHTGGRHLLVEVQDARRFQRKNPLPANQLVEVSERIHHLLLPETVDPAAIDLDWLRGQLGRRTRRSGKVDNPRRPR